MIESGVIKYGDDFVKELEKGNWDLNKVDKSKLKESKQH